MARYSRTLIALTILLSGLALIPQAGIFAGVVRWQRFAGGYEDVITVTRARYRDNELEVRAISSSGGLATLSVYRTSDNSFIGTLQFEGEDHRGEFNMGSNPQVITVRSSLGGESTVLVQSGSGVPVTVTPSITPTQGNPTHTPTSVPPTQTASVTPGGPTLTPTASVTPGGPTLTPTASVTPGGPTLTPTASVTPGGPTLTPTASVTPGGPTLTPTATTVVEAPTVTPTATTPSGSTSTLYLPMLYREGQ